MCVDAKKKMQINNIIYIQYFIHFSQRQILDPISMFHCTAINQTTGHLIVINMVFKSDVFESDDIDVYNENNSVLFNTTYMKNNGGTL